MVIPMRLAGLGTDDVDFLRQLLIADRREPVPIAIVDRLLDFAIHNRQPVRIGTDDTNNLASLLDQLHAGRRLVAWASTWEPDPRGAVAIPRSHGILVTLPENADIANFMTTLRFTSAVGHAVNGLAFGYALASVAAYIRSSIIEAGLMKDLKRAGLRRFSIVPTSRVGVFMINLVLLRAERTPTGRSARLAQAEPILATYGDVNFLRDAGGYLSLELTLR